MQYSSLILAALATTGSLAAPHGHLSPDDSLQVILSGQSQPSTNTLPAGQHAERHPHSSGPFTNVELVVGKNVQKQDYRCQILDHMSHPIVLKRGANTDITFGDGDKGAWTFRDAPSAVSKVVCDPTFAKIDPAAAKVSVRLSNQGAELGTTTDFPDPSHMRVESAPVGSTGPYTSVEIIVGQLVKKQDIRCQLKGMHGMDVVATRGANTDTTFSDADKGEWTFKAESVVERIICDPAFKAAPKA